MIYTILGSFCSYLDWEGADIRPLIMPRKIIEGLHCTVIVLDKKMVKPFFFLSISCKLYFVYLKRTVSLGPKGGGGLL